MWWILILFLGVVVLSMGCWLIRSQPYAILVYIALFGLGIWSFGKYKTFLTNRQQFAYANLFHREAWGLLREPEQPNLIRRIIPNRLAYHPQTKSIRVYTEPKSSLSKQTYNIWFDYEGHRPESHPFDLVLTSVHPQSEKCIYVPRWSLFLSTVYFMSPTDVFRPYVGDKNKFCATLAHSHPLVPLLQYYNPVDLLQKRNHHTWSLEDIKVWTPYRFALVVEEKMEQGWVSERVLLPLLAGCIVVYVGASNVVDHFKAERLVQASDFPSLPQCVARVLALNEAYPTQQRPTGGILTASQFREHVGWYVRDSTFFKDFYRLFPALETTRAYSALREVKVVSSKCVKIINLDRSTDRWQKCLEQLERHPLKDEVERFSAVDGAKAKVEHADWIRPRHPKMKKLVQKSMEFQPGEVGVYLSNMEIYYTLCKDKENDFYLILEDDVFLQHLEHPRVYAQEAPEDWDLIFVGHNKVFCSLKPNPTGSKYVRMGYGCMPGAFAYIVRKRAAQYFLNFGVPMELEIDQFIRYQSANLNVYARVPAVVDVEYINDSTISNSLR